MFSHRTFGSSGFRMCMKPSTVLLGYTGCALPAILTGEGLRAIFLPVWAIWFSPPVCIPRTRERAKKNRAGGLESGLGGHTDTPVDNWILLDT
jgi:hypothetical protein